MADEEPERDIAARLLAWAQARSASLGYDLAGFHGLDTTRGLVWLGRRGKHAIFQHPRPEPVYTASSEPVARELWATMTAPEPPGETNDERQHRPHDERHRPQTSQPGRVGQGRR